MQAHYRLDARCFDRHGLGPANLTTGSYSKWGKCCAEFLTPRQVGLIVGFGLGLGAGSGLGSGSGSGLGAGLG